MKHLREIIYSTSAALWTSTRWHLFPLSFICSQCSHDWKGSAIVAIAASVIDKPMVQNSKNCAWDHAVLKINKIVRLAMKYCHNSMQFWKSFKQFLKLEVDPGFSWQEVYSEVGQEKRR